MITNSISIAFIFDGAYHSDWPSDDFDPQSQAITGNLSELT